MNLKLSLAKNSQVKENAGMKYRISIERIKE